MRKLVCAAIASAFMLTAAVPNPAHATPAPIPAAGGGAAAGAGFAAGFIIFVALLDSYDLIRRTTCSGDFLGFGGPGFDSPITPAMTVLPPQCPPVVKHRRHRKH